MLNRVLRWADNGVEYEADPRQGVRLLESLALDGDGCKAVATPGQKAEIEKLREDKPLSEDEHTAFRAIAARPRAGGPRTTWAAHSGSVPRAGARN